MLPRVETSHPEPYWSEVRDRINARGRKGLPDDFA